MNLWIIEVFQRRVLHRWYFGLQRGKTIIPTRHSVPFRRLFIATEKICETAEIQKVISMMMCSSGYGSLQNLNGPCPEWRFWTVATIKGIGPVSKWSAQDDYHCPRVFLVAGPYASSVFWIQQILLVFPFLCFTYQSAFPIKFFLLVHFKITRCFEKQSLKRCFCFFRKCVVCFLSKCLLNFNEKLWVGKSSFWEKDKFFPKFTEVSSLLNLSRRFFQIKNPSYFIDSQIFIQGLKNVYNLLIQRQAGKQEYTSLTVYSRFGH